MYAIRRARRRELPALRGVERLADERFKEMGLAAVAESGLTGIDDLEAACEEGCLWVADADGEPVGFAVVELVDGIPHLDELSVHPEHGRRGLGRRLVDMACRWARERGHDALTLTTFAEVPWNGPWYRRLGFQPVPDTELGPELRARRLQEVERGLDAAGRREVLRLDLAAE